MVENIDLYYNVMNQKTKEIIDEIISDNTEALEKRFDKRTKKKGKEAYKDNAEAKFDLRKTFTEWSSETVYKFYKECLSELNKDIDSYDEEIKQCMKKKLQVNN